MPRLLHDRYLECDGERAWDLATGTLVRLGAALDSRPETIPSNAALLEVLDHGRDGSPRLIVSEAGAGTSPEEIVGRAARDASARGFVPIAVHMYGRVRTLMNDELEGRTLMLVASPTTSPESARQALLDAASRSARPHMLLQLTQSETGSGVIRHLVREAPAAYGTSPAMQRPRTDVLPADVARHVARAQRAVEFLRAGRHAAAERLLRDTAGALVRRRAFESAAQTFIELGRALLERGRALDADRAFEEAVDAMREDRAEPLILDARIWQAMARTEGGRLTEAESLCRAMLLTNALSADRRSWVEAGLASVLWWQGRADEVDAAPWPMWPELDDVVNASIADVSVTLLIHQGRTFEAGCHARDALNRTAASDDPLALTIALTSHLRVLCAMGDLTLAAECFSDVIRHARTARTPFRAARARLVWLDALRRAGRNKDAADELARVCRIRRVAPPLLKRAIDFHQRDRASPQPPKWVETHHDVRAAALVRVSHQEERDDHAVRAVLAHVAETLRTSRIDLVCADAGPVSTIMSLGAGMPTRLGERVIEAGIVIGPEAGDAGREIGVPVRMGLRLLAAVVARWPIDVVPAPATAAVLDVAAAVLAPRIDAMLAAARESAMAAAAVPELVGAGTSMADVRKAIARAAQAPFAVLIEGESGVGKELVARAIHQLGPRRERRFCDVNCAALPEELLESELFGHARGAFTGAVADRAGLFEEANGGTVFLDEVADLSPRAQAKLLRVLQQHEVRRVGEAFSRKIDVRLISAANREMRHEAAEGRFRQDLLYRLDVIRVHIPPLRDRPEDIPLLATHFWRGAAARVGSKAELTHAVIAALSRYHWPGNVRELQNVIAALAVAAPSRGRVRASLLPSVVTGATALTSTRLSDARTQFERRFVEVALARAGGSRARAAREMGLSRQGLQKMMARLGLGAERTEESSPQGQQR